MSSPKSRLKVDCSLEQCLLATNKAIAVKGHTSELSGLVSQLLVTFSSLLQLYRVYARAMKADQ